MLNRSGNTTDNLCFRYRFRDVFSRFRCCVYNGTGPLFVHVKHNGNMELHFSATFQKYGNMWFRPVLVLHSSRHRYSRLQVSRYLPLSVWKRWLREDFLRSHNSIEGFRLFTNGHLEDLKYPDLIDDGIIQAIVGNSLKNFMDLSFFSTWFMESFRFTSHLSLNSFRIILLSALNIDKVLVTSSIFWRSMSVWQETVT